MRFIHNIKVSGKLIIGFFIMIILMAGISLSGFSGIRKIQSRLNAVFMVNLPSVDFLIQTDRDLQQLLVSERSMIFANVKTDEFQNLVNDYEENFKQSVERWNQYKALDISPEERALIPRYEQVRTEWEKISREIVNGRISDTREGRRKALDLSLGTAKAKFEEMRGYLDQLTGISLAKADNAHQTTGPIYRMTLVVLFSITGLGLLLAVMIVWILSRAITKPIRLIAEGARRFSIGDIQLEGMDLNAIAEINSRKDELGDTGRAFSQLIAYMKEKAEAMGRIADGNLDILVEKKSEQDQLGASLIKMIHNLNVIMKDLYTAIEQVDNGSRQVSDSSQSLSQGATQQAASLEEITSSMTQIGSQTKTNAENAGQANQLGLSTKEASSHGVQQMELMTKAMDEINQSSKKIAKIIKTIDDIAFQTNLLALNAAVEAARAGHHGKGFAVVAQEVRSLAAKSAKAAQETAEMIESGNQKVDHGLNIAAQTSESLAGINEGITKVTDIINEIAAASNEQAQGISQVNIGLSQIDSVTQQNTANAEETSAAAVELAGQASHVRNLLSRFKLSSTIHQSEKTHYPPARMVAQPAEKLINWGPQYSVGVRNMDQQHMRLIDLINELYSALKSGKAVDVQESILDGLISYTREHFAKEEALLRVHKFQGLAEHEKMHRGFEAKISEYQEKMRSGASLGVDAINFLKDWLVNHIQKADKQYEHAVGDNKPANIRRPVPDYQWGVPAPARVNDDGRADPRQIIRLDDEEFGKY
ncbi:MAG: HAMP domain-containing protein [Desulfobacteraceae bacterium]|nr:MAG: HAMP domain-containing protein [Desulfobacteraceae bacterium]